MSDVAAPRVGVPIFSGEKWEEFVVNSRIGDVNMHNYYADGKIDSSSALAHTLYSRVLSELFADGVAVGAVVLPDDYVPADFVFEAEVAKERLVQRVDIVLGSKPDIKSSFVVPYRFRENPLLSDLVAVETLQKIFEGAEFVISRDFFRPSLKF